MSATNFHSNTCVGQTFDATALPERLLEIVYLQDHKAIDYVTKCFLAMSSISRTS